MKSRNLIAILLPIVDNYTYKWNTFQEFLHSCLEYDQLFQISNSYIFREMMKIFCASICIDEIYIKELDSSEEKTIWLDGYYYTLSNSEFFDFISQILIRFMYDHFSNQFDFIDELQNNILIKIKDYKRPLNIVETLIGNKVNKLVTKLSQIPHMLENIFSFIPFESLFVIGFNLLKNDFANSFQKGKQEEMLVGNFIPPNIHYNIGWKKIQIRHFRSVIKLFRSCNISLTKNNSIVYIMIQYMYHDDLENISKACAPVQKTSILTMSQTWDFECHKEMRRKINSGRMNRRQRNRKHMKILKKWKQFVIRLMHN